MSSFTILSTRFFSCSVIGFFLRAFFFIVIVSDNPSMVNIPFCVPFCMSSEIVSGAVSPAASYFLTSSA